MSLPVLENDILKQQINSFFYNNKDVLLDFYPGLTLNRLYQEFGQSSDFSLIQKQLLDGVPLEYISSKSYFYNIEIEVNNNVLIPRNETEVLIDYILDEISKRNNGQRISLVDIGTGPGTIALTLLKNSDVVLDVLMTDISALALELAKKNSFLLQYNFHPSSTFEFQCCDRLAGIDRTFDLIVSNHPYIKTISDKKLVHHQVLKYEPHVALFINDDIYEKWFCSLFKDAYLKLNRNGLFFMEGHEDHLAMLSLKLEECGFKEIELIKDYADCTRFLKGRKVD